ncbi:hypothetical protein I7I50_05453 [Histoplasma capsulatum G186AR]|nr:hypothetical protein I7I52_03714 [Histoplasma capsulatum]QSS76109.1 hypothetical protein I7I50_05453 [Histoplasma capsulatum G186AR]
MLLFYQSILIPCNPEQSCIRPLIANHEPVALLPIDGNVAGFLWGESMEMIGFVKDNLKLLASPPLGPLSRVCTELSILLTND